MRQCNKCVCYYSNYAASITYSLHWKWFFIELFFATLQFSSLLSTLDWALTSSVSLEGTLVGESWRFSNEIALFKNSLLYFRSKGFLLCVCSTPFYTLLKVIPKQMTKYSHVRPSNYKEVFCSNVYTNYCIQIIPTITYRSMAYQCEHF